MKGDETLKYNIIYADPPWQYRQSKGQGVAENHYLTMPIEDICNLPVSSISHNDSILFLWTTFPQLPEALTVMRSWGFTYKTVAFVWVKQNKSGNGFFFGLGYWTRSNVEICLLGVKGHPKRVSKKVHQLIVSPLERHSKKPDIIREKIIELVGDLPRIELFARQETAGWDIWGNEVKSSISLERLCKH
ncbi:MT-A70 family methyltransferase [Anaerocolumna aminovalerica]|uniref:MT-A70 family methyltransferase n=1 Tax=Anaerocolumna aminovalerica TaxID=1527 RepID=UPI000B86EAB5|nr:MT-A70 family methyltransferase [Anaerocolumna aminovalerica]